MQSFAFTIRPIAGVRENSELENLFRKMLKKYPGFLVAEKTGIERHLHGQVFFENPRTKSDFHRDVPVKYCKKALEDWSPQQERVLKSGTKIAYSNDFYTEYCNKEDSVMLVDNFPEDATSYYPSQEEQDKVKARANAKDATHHHLLEMWREKEPDNSYPTEREVAKFLYDIMYVSKTYHVISDPRRRGQIVKSLTQYINADISLWEAHMLPQDAKAKKDKWTFIKEITGKHPHLFKELSEDEEEED
jgi:hypothetical protein